MPITANYNAATKDLTVSGDTADDTITVSRDEAGNLLVNNGTVTITGGTPTVSNTDRIDVFGGEGEDSITADDLPIHVRVYGEGGNDSLMGRAWFYGGAGNDTLIGLSETRSRFEGGDGDDTLVASYDAILVAGDGTQDMIGGPGNDQYYVTNPLRDGMMGMIWGDYVVDVDGEGHDRVFARTSYSLHEYLSVEVLSPANVAGTAGAELGGNHFDNQIYGSLGNDQLQGGGGSDTIIAHDGDDTLHGGTGADSMAGGLGNDTYYVDNVGDVVNEAAGDGSDQVLAMSDYVLAAGVSIETLSTSSMDHTTAIDLTGNEIANNVNGNYGDNVLTGGGGNDTLAGHDGYDTLHGDAGADTMTGGLGNDTLDGGTGADAMIGGLGNDWFYVDAIGDTVDEAAGEGTDRIFASASYVLAAGVSVETLSIYDTSATTAIDLTGNELANNLYGNYGDNYLRGGGGHDTLIAHNGNDTLDGEAGSDSMWGGLGDDWFHIDGAGDTANEAAGQGTDRVFASTSYILTAGTSIETLSTSLAGETTAINLTGNELANNVYGNFGDNYLRGGGGNDTLIGHDGNDTLDGGTGSDSMWGGLGNDWFYVNSSTDGVNEAAGQGTDRIFTSSNYVLAAGVSIETLSTDNTTATTAMTLIGNELANSVYGNNGNNSLYGSSGNDTLIAHDGADLLNGGEGADSLTGGAGADTFVFADTAGAGNIDSIGDYSVADDVIHIDNAVFTGLAAGALAAEAFRIGVAAADADDRVVYNSATGALWFDADGNGAGAAVQFTTLATGLAMAASEFFVI